MAKVRLEGLTKRFGSLTAVHDLNLELREGEFFTILGPSGAGKTTTLELIAGIKRPDSGSIYFDDTDVTELFPQERNVAMAFEYYSLYPHMNVYENILFPLNAPVRRDELSEQEKDKKVRDTARLLGIEELLNRKPQQLSGGQKQRASLARAMIRTPTLYLLDEPIAHLDAKLKVSARTTLKRLAASLGTTIIYVTHDFKEALALSDRILILRKGRMVQLGAPEEIYLHPADDFVARLVGEPPINLIDGTLEGDTFSYGDRFRFHLSSEGAAAAREVSAEDNRVRIGIRPDYVRVSETKGGEEAFEMPVYAVEHEADRSIVTFRLEDVFLLAKTEQRVSYGLSDKLWISFDPEHLYFFRRTLPAGRGATQ